MIDRNHRSRSTGIRTYAGSLNPTALRTLRARLPSVPLVADDGIGYQRDAMHAMELGYDAVLVNSAVALAHDPVAIARAFQLGIEAGASRMRPASRPIRG